MTTDEELKTLNYRFKKIARNKLPKKGSHIKPRDAAHNIAFVWDGEQYILWEDQQSHWEDIYLKSSSAKEFIQWLDHRYDQDPIGKMRMKNGYGGIAWPMRILKPRFGPRGTDSRTLKLKFMSEDWLKAWDNYILA